MKRLILAVVSLLFWSGTAQAQMPSDVARIAKAELSGCANGQMLIRDNANPQGVSCATPGASGGIGSSSNTQFLVNVSGSVAGTGYWNAASRNLGLGDTTTFQSVTTGTSNFFLGNDVGSALTSGGDNAAMGALALQSITTGGANIAMGSQAGQSLTQGDANTLIGFSAGNALTTGDNNVAIGFNTSYSTTGSENVFIGSYAGNGNADLTGTDNIFIGHEAGYMNTVGAGTYVIGIGYHALAAVQGGSNIGIGANACATLTTGTNNVCLGTGADVTTTTSNTMVFGNSSVTDAYFGSTTAAATIRGAGLKGFGITACPGGQTATITWGTNDTGALVPTRGSCS